jgi:GTP cyclohydrolase I
MDTINYFDMLEETETQGFVHYNGKVSNLVQNLLVELGEDPERDGLKRTPERVSRMFGELLSGYQKNIEELVNGAIFESDYQDIVLVRNIEFYSLCEHHMLPFYGRAHVAYLPDGKIIGLSKIPRLVDMFARRLQVQERMTQEIAIALNDIIKPRGVAVMVEGAHMCAMMRGVKKENASMVTQSMLGAFKTDQRYRSEFLAHIQRGGDNPIHSV